MFSLKPPPPSPCQGICRLEDDCCVGCGRSIGEIIEWPSAAAERKSSICLEAAGRLARMHSKPSSSDPSA